MMTYSLDPDFRRRAPDTGPYCACCQKPIRREEDAVKATVSWQTWRTAEGHDQRDAVDPEGKGPREVENVLIGKDCWRKVKKRPWD